MAIGEIELWVRRVAGLGGLLTLAFVLIGFTQLAARPVGRSRGIASRFLGWPYLFVATFIFLGFGYLLWRPLPLTLPNMTVRWVMLYVGALIYSIGLSLYWWGYRTLGKMFGVASGFGARLYADHRLVTEGPYRVVRHPMYAGVILTGWGGLLIYQTWAMAIFAFLMLGLVFRGRREEELLAEVFGPDWEAYCSRVAGWFPNFFPDRGNR
jgi:protein-S-isoprenylcysteine O-methyltransferase Ste14